VSALTVGVGPVDKTGSMRWLTALLAVTVLAPAGCGGQASPAADGADPIGTGKTADYDFTGTTLDGDAFDGRSLEGKPAVVWFWAPWCPTCRAQAPTVAELAEKYDGQVAVVGVGGLDSQDAIEEFADQVPHVTHLVDDEGTVWRHFRVTAQSTYTVIDADGEIITEGYLDDDELVALVDQLAD
jgi:thiol-disulfide isomerase/thioredoxin